jgi:galactonate dehydratase
LIGQDPLQIERHVTRLYRDPFWRGGPVLMSAISGVEHCLWDIAGKAYGQPVYKLLGGACWDGIRVYANGWFAGARTPEEYARCAADAVAQGYTALKWDPFGGVYDALQTAQANRAVACVRAVRQATGPDVDLLIEVHGRLATYEAIVMANRLAEFQPYFIEEPVPPENIDAMALVARQSPIPVATGERLFGRHGYRELFEKQAAAIIQPDPCHAGGILETKKIAAMAEPYYMRLAPHNPNGPVATAVCLHIAACTSNFLILETTLDQGAPWRDEMLTTPLVVHNGVMPLPTAAGLGIELNVAAFVRYPYQPRTRFLFAEGE